jgi:hypothetical protein
LRKQSGKRGVAGKQLKKVLADKQPEKDWNAPLVLDREELVDMLQDCLTDFATEVGLKVACLLFEKQVDISSKCPNSGHNGVKSRRPVVVKKSPRRKG